jgi:hypothetical protein
MALVAVHAVGQATFTRYCQTKHISACRQDENHNIIASWQGNVGSQAQYMAPLVISQWEPSKT